MLVTASRQKGVLEEDEQEMLHKVFEFADKDAADVMVPRPDVVALPVEMPVRRPAEPGAAPPLHALPGVRGRPGRRARHPPRARPVQRDERPRDRAPGRADAAPRTPIVVPETKAPGRAAGGVPAHLEPHGDRGRRVRLDGRPGHAGGSARGDRRRDRGRVRPARRGGAADRPGAGADRRLVPDRGVQRALRHWCSRTTTTTRWADSSSASSAGRRAWGTPCLRRRPLRGVPGRRAADHRGRHHVPASRNRRPKQRPPARPMPGCPSWRPSRRRGR